MDFPTVMLSHNTLSGLLDIHVTTETIEMLWDGVGGPQTGPEIVEQWI
jgi:hypothetical protein